MYYVEKDERIEQETDELIKRLVETEESYRKRIENLKEVNALPQEKLEYDLSTDVEIEATAEREARKQYEESAGKTNDRYDALREELKAQADSRKALAEQEERKLEEEYRERRKDAENQALARGLGRSSVIMGQIEEFDRGKIDDKSKLYAEYADALTEITSRLNSLEAKRTAELNALEYESAGATEENIRRLREEREKKLAEMIKYNNTIAEKQQRYSDSKGGDTAERIRVLTEASAREKYGVAKRVLDQIPAAEAFETMVSNRRYQELLGDYYSTLLNYYRKKM